TTASGATCCWSTLHIVFTDAGAAVGVEYPRNSVVSSGPLRRRVETPRSRHCAREKRERGGSGVARMRSKVRVPTRGSSSGLGSVGCAVGWRSRPPTASPSPRRSCAAPQAAPRRDRRRGYDGAGDGPRGGTGGGLRGIGGGPRGRAPAKIPPLGTY